jgi:hypothetical protein
MREEGAAAMNKRPWEPKLSVEYCNEDGEVEAFENELEISGCGKSGPEAFTNLVVTIQDIWDEFSATQAGRLSDGALELLIKMRRLGIDHE